MMIEVVLTEQEILKLNVLIDNGGYCCELGDEIFGYLLLFYAGMTKKKKEMPETEIRFRKLYTKIFTDNGYNINEVKNKLKTIKVKSFIRST
jgi:hypothetical protein